MIDNHVHVGWYSDGYHSPKEVWLAEQEAGINEIAVSSTSTCAELYKLVVHEMEELVQLGGSRVHPILWLTPRMIKTWGIRYMLRSKIQWQGVKMHWKANREWYYNHRLTAQAMGIARKLHVPVLLHTGEFKECHMGYYKPLCLAYPDNTFVFAHGRPIAEAKELLRLCPNTMVDTAFMPVDHVKELADAGHSNRILFGTDIPINLIYNKKVSTANYIRNCLMELQNKLSPQQYKEIVNNKIYAQNQFDL